MEFNETMREKKNEKIAISGTQKFIHLGLGRLLLLQRIENTRNIF